jgi:hypothetical protein
MQPLNQMIGIEGEHADRFAGSVLSTQYSVLGTRTPRTRREVLRAGGLTMLGLTLADWFRLAPQAAAAGSASTKARSCILLWLDGGPSHLDTYDLKPDAPEEVRGPFAPIETNVPGIRLCELLPQSARLMDKAAILRSITSPLGEHNFGSHYLLTGYKPTPVLDYPSYGSVVAHTRGGQKDLPPYVAVPDYNRYAGEGYLPAAARPFAVLGDPSKPGFRVRDLDMYAGLTDGRLARRREYLAAFDRFSSAVEDDPPSDPQFEQAYRLMSSPAAKQAFDLSAEPPSVRQRYGFKSIGQSCLLARRLIEAGVRFVTVTDRGWDTHQSLSLTLKEGYTGGTVGKVPTLDLAWSALIADLHDRGLLEETLVIVMGEFGRTPKINTLAGRDHWPRVFSVLLAGGGVRGGQVVGASDARGESPAERPVTPTDLACTIYTLLGIDPDMEFHTADGRPVRASQGGQPISEVL